MGSADELAGVYIVASLARDGRCSVAADPVGAGLLYWGESPEALVLSTRAAVAASLLAVAKGTAPRRDALGTGWLAYMGMPMGHRTGFEDISLVPDGAVVEIDPTGTIDLHRSLRAAWRRYADELAADPHAALDEARAEMTTAICTALRDPGTRRCLGLTGGKDSRLILAPLLADGLASDLEYQTLGADDLPDVVVARQLASIFGLRCVISPGVAERWAWRRRVDTAVRESSLRDSPSREIAFRITARVTSGMTNAGEPHLGRLPPDNSVLLSGLFGESLPELVTARSDVQRPPTEAPASPTSPPRAEALCAQGAVSASGPWATLDLFDGVSWRNGALPVRATAPGARRGLSERNRLGQRATAARTRSRRDPRAPGAADHQ